MTSGRTFLSVIGLAIAVAGVVVAVTVERLFGLGVLTVGAFLFVLPFTTRHPDE